MSRHKKQAEGYKVLKDPANEATLELEKITGLQPNRKLRRKLLSRKYGNKRRRFFS